MPGKLLESVVSPLVDPLQHVLLAVTCVCALLVLLNRLHVINLNSNVSHFSAGWINTTDESQWMYNKPLRGM